jgi:nuclear pore complex protein Nup62
VAVPPPSVLRGKTIEEIVNRWSTDLESHVREFNRFAGEVAVWDRALIENGNNVSAVMIMTLYFISCDVWILQLAALYSHVLAAEREQNDIDQSLDHIDQQQKDLASTLDIYEKATLEMLGGQGGSLRALDTGPADTERDKK